MVAAMQQKSTGKSFFGRTILAVSLIANVVLTIPLITFVILDGSIQRQIYMHAAAHFGKHDIAFIGDSIVAEGFVWANKIGVYNLNVWNYAVGGFKTEQIAFHADRVAREKFKFCFVMGGANDGLKSDDSIRKSYDNYIGMLQTLRMGSVEPIVTLVLYREKETLKENKDSFNKKIRKYCASNNIAVIDLNPLLCDETGLKKEYSRDGVHLKNRAYEIWGSEINRVLHDKGYL